jgi:rubrerythrin
MRPIDADELKKAIGSYVVDDAKLSFNKLYENEDLLKVYQLVTAMPTIDVEPIKHGKWIKADSQQYFRKHYPAFTCSECGQRKDSQKTWNYCPNCGARMQG